MTSAPTTLTRFLIEEQRCHEHATGNFTALVKGIAERLTKVLKL